MVGNGWEWLGNGWGISNLCAPLRGIPGRGLFFPQKSAPFYKKCIFCCFYHKTSLFKNIGKDNSNVSDTKTDQPVGPRPPKTRGPKFI